MMTEEMIARFFKKECTAEEAEQVAAWLQAHPEMADQYLNDEVYNSLQPDENLSNEAKEKAWRFIHQSMVQSQKSQWLKRSAVAASVAAFIAMSLFLFTKKQSNSTVVSSYKKEAKTNVNIADTEYNFTNSVRRIAMADGSVISLSPKSYVWFYPPFGKRQRNVYLHGEARFEVAKNKQKPFTVFAGSFATTALGTEFIVRQKNEGISIQLMHGKVVIQNTNNTIKNWKNIYLLPGEQMTYNEKDAVAKVSQIESKKTIASNKAVRKSSTQTETEDSLLFNGTAMQDVLQKLHTYYGVNIQFNPSEVKHISFTGTFAKKDSVENILKILTQMNGLSVQKQNDAFIILKQNIEQ